MMVLDTPKFPSTASIKTGWPLIVESPPLPDTMPDGSSWPRISIVTPVYNQVQFIEATVRSILCQGYPNLEYIIIDGGSTDGTVDIIRKYEPYLTYWKSEKDNGMYDAINKGFSHASGSIMAWLNADDIYFPWTFELVAQIFVQHRDTIDWISGVHAFLDAQERLVEVTPTFRYSRRLIALGLHDGRCLPFIAQDACFWTRSLWQGSGGRVDTGFQVAGDFDLWRRFAKQSELYVIPTVMSGFRLRAGQLFGSNKARYYREVDASLEGEPGGMLRKLWRLPGISRLLSFVVRKHLRKSKSGPTLKYLHKRRQWLIQR